MGRREELWENQPLNKVIAAMQLRVRVVQILGTYLIPKVYISITKQPPQSLLYYNMCLLNLGPMRCTVV